MASTYTTGFSLEKIGSGEQAGTWGTTSNHNWDIVDRLASYKAVALSDASTATLTVREASPGSGTENLQNGMYRAIKFTGSLSQDCTVTIAPNTAPAWFIIENAAGDDVILSQGSGANVTVQNGKNVIVYCDGAGGGAAVVDALADLQIGTLEVTGAAAIDGALTQAGASQFNSTITVGVDDTGYDVKFFGATSGAYMLWDESADDLKLVGAAGLTVAGDIDVDGTTNLDVVDVDGAVNFAADVTFADGADIITASAGTSNFRAGVNAGNSIASGGNYNVAVGDEAGTALNTGDNNTFVGYAAGDAQTTASNNVAVGHNALGANTTGTNNVAIGAGALATCTTDGNHLIGIGYQALAAAAASQFCVAIGKDAGLSITSGNANTLIGYHCGDAINTGSNNTAMGWNALGAITTVSACTAFGYSAGSANTSGVANVYVGAYTGDATTTGGYNTFLGDAAGGANISGAGNTFVGQAAGTACTSGGDNTAIGQNALDALTTVGQLVAVGKNALGANTSGTGNNAFGYNAGGSINSGNSNTIVGHNAGDAVTTGGENVIIGQNSGGAQTTASENVIIGNNCAAALTTGGQSIYIGDNAAAGGAVTGIRNVVVGDNCLYNVVAGGGNIALGYATGHAVTSGDNNVLLGTGAGDNITTGSNNICIGNPDGSAVGAANNIVLGYGIAGPGDNVVAFGKAGNVTQNTFTSNATWTQSSDERLKTDIKDNTLGLDFINEMETKTYRWKPSYDVPKELTNHYFENNQKDTEVLMYGMMAQKVKASMDKHENPEFTGWEENKDGSQNLSREMFVVPLIKAVQELSAEIEELKKWKEEHTCCG